MHKKCLAGFVAGVGTVHLLSDTCPLEIPVSKGGGSCLVVDHCLAPCSALRLAVSDTGVKEIATCFVAYKASSCVQKHLVN